MCVCVCVCVCVCMCVRVYVSVCVGLSVSKITQKLSISFITKLAELTAGVKGKIDYILV